MHRLTPRRLDRRTLLRAALVAPAAAAAWDTWRSALRASASSAVVGRVTDLATGQPIGGARLGARFQRAEAWTAGDGNFHLPIQPGVHEVTCIASGYVGASRPGVLVGAESPARVDFALLPSAADPRLDRLAEAFRPGDQLGLFAEPDGEPRVRASAMVPCSVQIRQTDGSLRTMDMNEYLRGVVPSEMPAWWGSNGGFEALKAQAVAARSYAVAVTLARGWLYADTRDQVWNPANVNDVTDNAVTSTGYEVLTAGGRVITGFYSASCGGHGADGGQSYTVGRRDHLPSPAAAPARLNLSTDDAAAGFWGAGQSPDAFCKVTAPGVYRWPVTWQREKLEATLDTYLSHPSIPVSSTAGISAQYRVGELGTLVGMAAIRRGNSGKILTFRITGRRNGQDRTWDVHSEYWIRFVLRRSADDPFLFRSANLVFSFERNADGSIRAVTAYGGGYGHGVGLCQDGAYGMAQQGYQYREILAQYYSDAFFDATSGGGCLIAMSSPADGALYLRGSSVTLTWSGPYVEYQVEVRDAGGTSMFVRSYSTDRSVTVSTVGWPAGIYRWRVGARTDAGPTISAERQFVLAERLYRSSFPIVRE
ncbi:MAG: carboxypeptidase regulatory-like domain-containing protein [Chloroflexi bacterium]|nr:carboxypeptidase regulatory-like domain-containing protein [Chloroflexota bacterium]